MVARIEWRPHSYSPSVALPPGYTALEDLPATLPRVAERLQLLPRLLSVEPGTHRIPGERLAEKTAPRHSPESASQLTRNLSAHKQLQRLCRASSYSRDVD